MFLDGSKCTKTVSKDLVKLIPVVDDKPPFANYGCADLRPDIGMKRTHNVNVPPKWVCFVSLRGRGVRHFFSMFSLFYREFYTESSGFYLLSKFKVVFEISRQTCEEKSPFSGLKMAKTNL